MAPMPQVVAQRDQRKLIVVVSRDYDVLSILNWAFLANEVAQ
jgi:hypothetical protein